MILMNDFKAEPPELLQQQVGAAERVLKSGWFILGKELKAFEAAWAKTCGTDFAVGVGNGMEALEIGLRALDIGAGDEVITTPMTAMATIFAIIRVGATPVLADIEPGTALLKIESVERCLTSKTKAVLLVHLYGKVSRMNEWQSFCAKNKIRLIEDCAQSHLASADDKIAGSFGEFGAYSFYPTKNLGARGDAGMIVTNSETLAEHARRLRNYGQENRYHHSEVGMNSRLDEMQAAILSARLPSLADMTAQRQRIARFYFENISNPRIEMLAKPAQPENHVYHLFVIRCPERDRLADFLRSKGIETLVHYPVPGHHQAACKDLRRDPGGLPNAERHARECLSIPCHPHLTQAEMQQVVAALNEFGN